MVVRYDKLNRMEKPKLTLCNPGSVYNDGLLTNVVGILSDHEAEEIVFNFNATSELNFRLNRIKHDNANDNAHAMALYKAVQNRRLIFVDDIGFFMITNIKDGYEDGAHYKDVTAQSIDVELQQKMIPFIEDGTYPLVTDEDLGSYGIIDLIAEVIPQWTIGYIDTSVATKWRTFEDVDVSTNCLSFLVEKVQDAYECIVLFDIMNRVINIYDQESYVKVTNIHITKDDLINSIEITENADDIYTAINAKSNEDVTIAASNPIGTNVIYNFDYYLDWMSPGLSAKVSAWQARIEEYKTQGIIDILTPAHYYEDFTYDEASQTYYEFRAKAADLQFEIDRLNIQAEMYAKCRDNIVAESSTDIIPAYDKVIEEYGGEAIGEYEEVAAAKARIEELLEECNDNIDEKSDELESVNVDISLFKTKLSSINHELDPGYYFTSDERAELVNYIFEGDYTDEYVVITDIMTYEEKFEQMKTMYDRAKSQLDKVSKPTQEFDIDAESFIFMKEFEQWSEQLETGCIINVELDTDDVALLFLSSMTINYDDHEFTMTFGNRFNKFDPKSLFNDVLGQIQRSANTLSYVKDLVYPIKNGELNEMQAALRNSRNLTMGAAFASDDEEVSIDGAGYTGRRMTGNGEYDPRQIKITSQSIVFTDNAWESCKTAIGQILFGSGDDDAAYGINAEAIIGELIMGNNLRILDNDGNDLLTVVDGKISAQIRDFDENTLEGRFSSLEQTADNIQIRVGDLENQDGVKTAAGYTFDSDGLSIYKDGEDLHSLLDNKGLRVRIVVGQDREDVLVANNEGVNAINLTARQYLNIGNNSRFEDYNNGTDAHRTACFFIGESSNQQGT